MAFKVIRTLKVDVPDFFALFYKFLVSSLIIHEISAMDHISLFMHPQKVILLSHKLSKGI